MTYPLGERASFLLGMLVGAPRLPDELHALIGRLVEDEDGLVEAALPLCPNLSVTVSSLYDGGTDEVRRLLDRLVEFGLAVRVELAGDALYALPDRR